MVSQLNGSQPVSRYKANADSLTSMPEHYITAKFWIEVDSVIQGAFQECSGLQLQTEVFEYKEGGLNSYTHKLPVRTSVGNITLKRGLLEDDYLWQWYSKIVQGTLDKRTISIHVGDNHVEGESTSGIIWVLKEAMPVKWVGPAFKAGENSVAVTQLEFVFGPRKNGDGTDGTGALMRQKGT